MGVKDRMNDRITKASEQEKIDVEQEAIETNESLDQASGQDSKKKSYDIDLIEPEIPDCECIYG